MQGRNIIKFTHKQIRCSLLALMTLMLPGCDDTYLCEIKPLKGNYRMKFIIFMGDPQFEIYKYTEESSKRFFKERKRLYGPFVVGVRGEVIYWKCNTVDPSHSYFHFIDLEKGEDGDIKELPPDVKWYDAMEFWNMLPQG